MPLGKRFMVTSFGFFVLGGLMALAMRVQLALPETELIGPEVFGLLFTMHGSTMMYLFAVPFLEGLAIYLLPLMLGSRDLAFPRLTAFGYWTFLFGGILFYGSFFFGDMPDIGWFAYPPLSTSRFTGKGVDFWLLGLGLVEIAGITAGIEIVVTILKMRAPGMSISRLPLFVWALLATGVMIIFAFTTLLTATVLLELDRTMGTKFFDPNAGGHSLLWQHLFWFFGHPEVYISFLPATGIVSMVVAAFARRIVGYVLIAVAIILTAFVSFGLWVHHMYATGLPTLSMSFFAAASLMIAIASGVQVFAWIASLWGSRAALKTPLLFVLGFLFIFVLGGLTGVMIAIVPFDWQVHDTYFIVAHFHYVLIGGVVFPIFAGLHYWVPKITGRMLSERLGQLSFWLSFIGFNVTFFPMHIMGFDGMPRRVYTHLSLLNLGPHNLIATIGAFALGAGFILFVVNLLFSLRRGPMAGRNPWDADSLEWSIQSPPASYSFYAPPVVRNRHPLWTRPDARKGKDEELERISRLLTAEPADWRGTVTTDILTGRPQSVQYLPGPSYTPLVVALGLLVASLGVLVQVYLLTLAGMIFAAGAVIAWLYPDSEQLEKLRTSELPNRTGLPIFTSGARSVAWWGMICLIAALATVLGVLVYSYAYLRLFSDIWPQGGLPRPNPWLPLLVYGLLAAGIGPQIWLSRSFRADQRASILVALVAAALLGALFLAGHVYLQLNAGFAPTVNAYASIFFVTGWMLDLYALTAVALSIAALIRFYYEPEDRHGALPLQMQITAGFWYFTSAVAVVVYALLYVSPYVIPGGSP